MGKASGSGDWSGFGVGRGSGQLGNGFRGFGQGDLFEEGAEGPDAVGAEGLGPVFFELGEEGEADALGLEALLGEADQLGALVGGIGVALEVTEAARGRRRSPPPTAW